MLCYHNTALLTHRPGEDENVGEAQGLSWHGNSCTYITQAMHLQHTAEKHLKVPLCCPPGFLTLTLVAHKSHQ